MYLKIFDPIFYALACFFLGWIILKGLAKDKEGPSVWAVLISSFLLGQGILGIIWMALGLASDFRKSVILFILIFVIFIGLLFAKGLPQLIFGELRKLSQSLNRLFGVWKVLLVLSIFFILMLAVGAVTHVIDIDADGIYMSLPKIMAVSERLSPHPIFYYQTQIGLSGEIHQAAIMSFGNFEAAKAFSWFQAMAVAILILVITSLGKVRIKGLLTALILLLTSTTFFAYIGIGKADLYGAAFGLVAYYWALKTNEEKKIGPLILAGVFTGLAGIAKISCLPGLLVGMIVLIVWNRYLVFKSGDRHLKKFIKDLAFSGLIFLLFLDLFLISHLVKNQILFHEPFAPFIFIHAKGVNWADQAWISPASAKYLLTIYPIALVFGRFPMQGGNLSALTFGFLPLLLFRRPKGFLSNKLFQVLIVALLGVAVWMILRPAVIAPRYILATVLLFIPVIAYIVDNFLQGRGFRFLRFVIPVALGLSLLVVMSYELIHLKYDIFSPNKLEDGSISYKSAEFINQKASRGDRVYIAGALTFYLRSDLLQCLNNPQDKIDVLAKNRPTITWEDIYQKGFKYVIVQKIYYPSASSFLDPGVKPDWLEVNKIYDDSLAEVYSLKSKNPEQLPNYQCLNTHRNVWEVSSTKTTN